MKRPDYGHAKGKKPSSQLILFHDGRPDYNDSNRGTNNHSSVAFVLIIDLIETHGLVGPLTCEWLYIVGATKVKGKTYTNPCASGCRPSL